MGTETISEAETETKIVTEMETETETEQAVDIDQDRLEELNMETRNRCFQASGYYEEVTDYWENTREVRDIANILEPFYESAVFEDEIFNDYEKKNLEILSQMDQ